MKFALPALALLLVLTGCTTEAPAAPSTPDPTESATAGAPADPGSLLPATLTVITGETAQAEGTRVADGLQALIEGVVYTDDKSALVPPDPNSDAASFYAVYRTITLENGVDPLVMGAQLTSVLEQSGWSIYETTNENGTYLSALSSGDSGWFALVGGDATVDGQPVVTFQIASPDIQ